MEINITQFMLDAAPMDYSASRAEIGDNAGADTWRAACDDSEDWSMIATDEQREAFREHVRGFGAWDDDEIADMSNKDLNALFMQLVSGDMREADIHGQSTDEEWAAYEQGAEAGHYCGRICRSVTKGEFLYYIGD